MALVDCKHFSTLTQEAGADSGEGAMGAIVPPPPLQALFCFQFALHHDVRTRIVAGRARIGPAEPRARTIER